jgi:hypothetical protein
MASIIGVQEIQHTNGTSAATIDSSGRILTPARPSFFAYRSFSDAADTDYSSNVLVTFDKKQHDIGNSFDLSTETYTVPVSGVYHLSWQVRMLNVTSAGYVFTSLYKNGATLWGDDLYLYGNLEDPQGGNYQASGMSATVELSANDTLQLYVRSSGDTTSRIEAHTTFFSGFLVG